MSSLEIVLILYVLFGCVYWLRMAVGAVLVARRVPWLARLNPPEPESWPALSVIVTARNEAEALEAAGATLRSQDYPDLEIILVDDRSIDETGEIVDRIAAADPRVRPLHITHLPNGWLGKVHALSRGVEGARGRWLLLTDADVHLDGAVLRRAVAYCEHRRLDHLAAAPDMWSSTFLVDVAVAMFLRVLCMGMRCWAIDNPRSKAYIGVGAFNLVRRSALERTEGLEWLRLEVADDLGLGMMLKRSGARSALVNGTGLVGLYWYRSLAQMASGAEKAFASVARCRIWRLLAACGLLAAWELAPVVALIPLGHWGLRLAGLAMIAAGTISVVVLHRWANRPILPGLCAPLALPVNVALLLRAGWLGLIRGGVLWRGTLYPSKILREGSRVRFP